MIFTIFFQTVTFSRSDYDKSHKKERQVVTIEIVDSLDRLIEKRKLVTSFDTKNRYILGK